MAVKVWDYQQNSTDNPITYISSDKFVNKIKVVPTFDGFVFYKVEPEKGGPTPCVLQTRFTDRQSAIKAVKKYIKNSKPTKYKKYKEHWNLPD